MLISKGKYFGLLLVIKLIFINSIIIFAQTDSLFLKQSDYLYETGNKFFEKKDYKACLAYYRVMLRRQEVYTHEYDARLKLAYAAIQLGNYQEAENNFELIIDNSITNRDLIHEEGGYKWTALFYYTQLLIMQCNYDKARHCLELLHYYQKNTTTNQCSRVKDAWTTYDTFLLFYTNTDKSIGDLLSLMLNNSNYMEIKIVENKVYFVNMDELFVDLLLQKYTKTQIDSAVNYQMDLKIDSLVWSKVYTNTVRLSKINGKTVYLSYAPAYYNFMGQRVECTVDYEKQLKSSDILTESKKMSKKIQDSSFYKKFKGTLPRQTISNIECFEMPNFK